MKIIAKNKKAFFDYDIQDEITCWIILYGHEVKSIRLSQVQMKWSYAHISLKWELFITGLNIAKFQHSDISDYDPNRKRILLINKREIKKLESKIAEKWFTLVPTYIGLERNKIKVKVWIAKWKKKYEKKEIIKNRDIDRQLKRNFKI